MRYLFINSVYGVNSTGKIINKKCKELIAQGHECYVAYGRSTIDDDVKKVKIGNITDVIYHGLSSRIKDNHGLNSKRATKNFIAFLDEYKPDVIWIHNLHGYYINYKILFDWIKKQEKLKVVWTLHDCWAFTGHCSHFTIAKCEKWKTACFKCAQLNEYPKSIFCDNSRRNYFEKKNAFTGVKDMTIITPSKWLAGLVKNSFLKEYNVEVQYNTIDKNVFKPTASNFREKNNLENKKIVLAVAVGLEKTKGIDDIYKLREILDERYEFVLVGVPKKEIKKLPKGILGIERINDQKELAGIYTSADVFINPTHQDTFSMVNLEARSCGTPVVTYDVGGSPESAGGKYIVKENDILGMAKMIEEIAQKNGKNNSL